ncbi:MAG: hypothetical protein K0R14_1716 [Burkholderiales bacterium]|jgi:hypothetical protein|nr:hypothetical protein [Burkholderiales bacterium]
MKNYLSGMFFAILYILATNMVWADNTLLMCVDKDVNQETRVKNFMGSDPSYDPEVLFNEDVYTRVVFKSDGTLILDKVLIYPPIGGQTKPLIIGNKTKPALVINDVYASIAEKILLLEYAAGTQQEDQQLKTWTMSNLGQTATYSTGSGMKKGKVWELKNIDDISQLLNCEQIPMPSGNINSVKEAKFHVILAPYAVPKYNYCDFNLIYNPKLGKKKSIPRRVEWWMLAGADNNIVTRLWSLDQENKATNIVNSGWKKNTHMSSSPLGQTITLEDDYNLGQDKDATYYIDIKIPKEGAPEPNIKIDYRKLNGKSVSNSSVTDIHCGVKPVEGGPAPIRLEDEKKG